MVQKRRWRAVFLPVEIWSDKTVEEKLRSRGEMKFGVVLLYGSRKGSGWAWQAQGLSSRTHLVSQVRIQCPVHLQRGLWPARVQADHLYESERHVCGLERPQASVPSPHVWCPPSWPLGHHHLPQFPHPVWQQCTLCVDHHGTQSCQGKALGEEGECTAGRAGFSALALQWVSNPRTWWW